MAQGGERPVLIPALIRPDTHMLTRLIKLTYNWPSPQGEELSTFSPDSHPDAETFVFTPLATVDHFLESPFH